VNRDDDEHDAGDVLSEEHQRQFDELSPVDLMAIDQAILGVARERWLKVGYIVGIGMLELHLPHQFFVKRIIELATQGRLESRGNVRDIGASEVRLPGSAPRLRS
jgi:hypothetical protein